MLISYHNHTTMSDGTDTLAAMIDEARRAGITELGISDHFVIAPSRQVFSWAIAPARLDEYVEAVLAAARDTTDLVVRLGVEVDFFPETIQESLAYLANYPFDFIIGSVHFIEEFVLDLNAGPWEKLSQTQRDQTWLMYWQHIAELARTGGCDFIGHLDLPKKFNYFPSIDLTAVAMTALDAIAAADMAIEINTAGWHKPVNAAYPDPFYLEAACQRGIPLLINADAHAAQHLTRDFDRARRLAAAAGYHELVRYEKRGRFTYPLDRDNLCAGEVC